MISRTKTLALMKSIRQYLHTIIIIGLAFIIFSAAILFVIYNSFQDILFSSIAQQNAEFSAQADALSNIINTTISSYMYQVFYNPSVTKLRASVSLTPQEYAECVEELKTVCKSDFVDSVSIYNEHTGYVYTSDDELPDAVLDSFADPSTVSVFKKFESINRMAPMRRICNNTITDKRQRYYSFLNYETDDLDKSLKTGALMINVPYKWFESQLLSFDSTGSYAILDGSGRLIAAKNDALQSSSALFWYDIVIGNKKYSTNSYLIRKIGGKRMLCLYSRMKSSGWYCMRIMPIDEYIPGLTMLRDRFTLVIALVFLLLMIAFALILLFLYYPFLSIRSKLKSIEIKSDDGEQVSTVEQVTQLVEKSKNSRQTALLNDILSGRDIPAEQIPTAPLTLAIMEPAHARLIEKAARHFYGAMISPRDRYAVILLTGPSNESTSELCESFAKANDCRIYFSQEYSKVSELPDGFIRLMQLRSLRFRFHGQHVISENDVLPFNEKSQFSEKSVQRLISALKQGEFSTAYAIFGEILVSIKGDSFTDQQFAINRTVQLMRDLTAELELDESILSQLPTNLDEVESMSDLTLPFKNLFSLICGETTARRKRHVDDISAKAAKLIAEQCSDPMLTAGKIADSMGLSQAYLGRLFHSSYSMSISEYLNRMRVSRACELLKNTDLTIDSITNEIGFENSKYFFVVFKNIVGCTPRQYRINEQKADE